MSKTRSEICRFTPRTTPTPTRGLPASPFSADNVNGVLGRTNGGERFTAQTIDLEATRDLSIGRWWGLGTIGARYAEFSLQGLRPIGDSDFAIYTVARGSTLWGQTQSFAQSDVAYDSLYGSGQSQQSVFNRLDNNQTSYIAELQGGVQWLRVADRRHRRLRPDRFHRRCRIHVVNRPRPA